MAAVANLHELDIRVKKITFHSETDSMTVFDGAILNWRPRKKEWTETKEIISCVGNYYGLVENDHLHITAELFEDKRWGPQYQVYTSERVQPGTELELKKFLKSIKGIGTKKAELLIDQFGMNVISEIQSNPRCLDSLSLSESAKENIYQVIVENKSYEELLMFLQLYEVPPKHAFEIYSKYHENSVFKIRDNPYALYLDGVLDFHTTDRLNQSLGGSDHRNYRITAGVLACIRNASDTEGSLFVSSAYLPEQMTAFLGQSMIDFDSGFSVSQKEISMALDSLISDGYLVIDQSASSAPSIYLKSNYYDEKQVASRLQAFFDSQKTFFATDISIQTAIKEQLLESHYSLTSEQTSAIATSLQSPVSILTGGPGTGKSQTLAIMIQVIKKIEPRCDIRLCAPTGKAAVRMQELSNQRASTIHRLIGYPRNIKGEDELLCDFVIIDEFSMCDVQLCARLFKAISRNARVVIVGDPQQLPSVGPGLVLRDLIYSGKIPITTLTKIFRQGPKGNHIVENALAIAQAESGDSSIKLEYSVGRGGDFYFIDADEQSKIVRLIERSVLQLRAEGFSQSEIEVLSPIHAGPIGTENLNTILQAKLNPHIGKGYCNKANIELKIGDKVIQTKNNYDIGVFNGETGTVSAIDYTSSRTVLIEFPDRDVWYDDEQVDELELAYSITIHRSQGSEFQVVIIPVHESFAQSLNKCLLYTAITRAVKRVILIGSKTAFMNGLAKEGANDRNSNLVLRLQNLIK